MGDPVFSVLLAAYNGEAVIGRALESLRAQTRPDWEAIVVDDGSIDGTAAVVESYAALDPRIRLFRKANGGTSSARNVAAAHASAPLLALLDQDDAFLPAYFERMGAFIDAHPGFEIYSCNAFYERDDGSREPRFPEDSPIRSYSLEEMLAQSRIHPQALFRRSLMVLTGGFDEDRRCWTEDYDFWLRAMIAGACHIQSPEILAVYRWSADQKSSSSLACADSDAYILAKLIDGGQLRGDALRIARRHLRNRRRDREVLTNEPRAELERRVRSGDLRGVRTLYMRSSKGWSSPWKWFAAMPLVLVAPRSFARLLSGRAELR